MNDDKKDITEELLKIPAEELEIKENFEEIPEEVKEQLKKTEMLFRKSIEPFIIQTKSLTGIIKASVTLYYETLKGISKKLNMEFDEDKNLSELMEEIRKHIFKNNIDISLIEFTELELNLLEEILGNDTIEFTFFNKQFNKDIQTLHSIVPKNFLIQNGKVHNNLTEIAFAGIPCDVNVGTEKKKIYTKVLIDYKDKNVKLPSSFSPYDKVVFDAIVTLYEAGNKIFTIDMVFRCINGLTNKEKPTPQQKGAITKSIEKMRFLHCEIDYTEEANARLKHKEAIDEFKIEGYFLNADKIMVAAGGRKVEAYQLNKKPLLYEYAQFSKQIINIPIQLLNTKEVVNATDEIIVIREYLLTRIENAKKGYLSNKITYQSIFEQINLIDDGNQYLKLKIKRLKAAIKKILDLWKKENYINDFKEYKEGRAIKGIEILF